LTGVRRGRDVEVTFEPPSEAAISQARPLTVARGEMGSDKQLAGTLVERLCLYQPFR
jgi:hypothetical protein